MEREISEELIRLTEMVEGILVGVNHSHTYSEKKESSTVRWSDVGGINWHAVLRRSRNNFTMHLGDISLNGRYSIEELEEVMGHYHEIDEWARRNGALITPHENSRMYILRIR